MTTLAFIGLALVVALVLSSASLSQLHRSRGAGHALVAQRAAESVLALATERLITQADFATDSGSNSLEWDDGKGVGRLTFLESQSAEWGIPTSISNRGGTEAVEGWDGISLPPSAVHLVAVGESGGVTRTIDAVVVVSEFPYALAATGPIKSEGGLLVGGFSEDDLTTFDVSELGPADIQSNETGEAVELDGTVEVTGDVRAVGTVALGAGAVVRGIVEQGAEAVALPQIDVTELRPSFSYPLTPRVGRDIIRGPVHFNGSSLHLSSGAEFENGILYVNGDLKISGGLTGQGALLVNGDVELEGGASLSAENQLAIVAEGDVVVRGGGLSSFFQGLIYTEGDLIAEDITLLGSFVANRDRSVDPGSRLELKDVHVIHRGESTSLSFGGEEFRTQGSRHGMPGSFPDDAIWDTVLEVTGENFYLLRDLMHNWRRGNSEWDAAITAVVKSSQLRTRPQVEPHVATPDWIELGEEDIRDFLLLDNNLRGARFDLLHAGGGTPERRTTSTPGFSFDLNEFLSPENRTRIIHWRSR